ncbi:MAG: alpha/beta hydrolase [Leptospiraceae bacterium]|nr:alpha/beta hydrolase [Leptospiraceae bacterium]MCP5510569.1 alpha/beta hydrolase [Leptospiraceae bacterium]
MIESLGDHQKLGKFLNVKGTNIFTIDKGEGETVVLLHGFFSTSYSYRKILPLLQESFRVVAPDFPGIGFSEKSDEIYSHRMLAGFLFDFLTEISKEKVHIVAYDYSAPVSFLLLNEHPEKIKSLTLISPFTTLESLFSYRPLFFLNKKLLGDLVLKVSGREGIRFLFNHYLFDKSNPISESLLDDYQFLLFRSEGKRNFLKMCQNIDRGIYAKKDMESGMQKMIGGKQILIAENDRNISFKETENIKQYFRLSFAQRIPGGRMLMETTPIEVVHKIENLVRTFSRK